MSAKQTRPAAPAALATAFRISLVGAAVVSCVAGALAEEAPAGIRIAAVDSAKASRRVTKSIPATAETAAAALPGTVNLQSAQQQEMVLTAPIDRIAIADPSVADALVLKPSKVNGGNGSLLLFGKRAGTTNLLVWYKGRTSAASIDLVVDGDGLKGTGLRATGPVLTGSAPDPVSHAHANELIRQNFPESGGKTLIDQSTVATPGTVQVDVKIVEFSKTGLKELGFNFTRYHSDGSFHFGTYSPGSAALQSGGVSSLLPISQAFNLVVGGTGSRNQFALSALQNNNLARVLAEPTLVTQSGQTANFLAGGEIPVPVPQGLGSAAIQYKPFGIGLDVSPTVLGPDRVALRVAPQASELDYANAVTISGFAIPAIRTRRAETTVELGDGESFVIGGLVSKATMSSVDKIPLLGDLPVIGAFFKRLNHSSEEKELMIIVTPHLVRPLAKGAALPPLPGAPDVADPPVWTPYITGLGREVPGLSQ